MSGDISPCGIDVRTMSASKLLRICKPCTVVLDKLPDRVFGGLSQRQIRVHRLRSGQKFKFQQRFFQEERYENAKIDRRRKIALRVTQQSARRRGRARRCYRSTTKRHPSGETSQPPGNKEKQSCHLFTAFSEMLASLSPDGGTNFLVTEEESLLVGLLLEIPNVVRLKIVEIAAKASGWVRVNPEELSLEWLERLSNNGVISLASDFPAEFPTVLNALSIPELKTMCGLKGLPTDRSKPILIRELTILQVCDGDVLQLPIDDTIYDLRRVIRVEESVKLLIQKTAHLFLLPLRDTSYFREQSNPLLRIVRPCLPVNPSLKSIRFDGYSEIFRDREEFTRWFEAKKLKYTIEKAIARKNWTYVERRILEISMKEFYNVSSSQGGQTEILDSCFGTHPDILHQFSEKFVMVEVLSRGVEALVTSNINLRLAEEVLHLLLRQPDRYAKERCLWRYLLALVFEKMTFPEKAIEVAQYALKACGNCEPCRVKMICLVKRLSHNQSDAFVEICDKICTFEEDLSQLPIVVIKRRSASQGFQGLKRVYNVIENGAVLHLSVEELVINHFSKNGYPKGLDDEGRTLMNLCYLAVWEETYTTGFPYVFCAPWQAVPLDWGSPLFWITRENQLKEKLQKLSQLQPEEVALHLCEKKDTIGEVAGTVDWNVLDFDPKCESSQEESLRFLVEELWEKLQAIHPPCKANIEPLEMYEAVSPALKSPEKCLLLPMAAICTRLLSGGRRGFPDLMLWNEEEKKCLFVEVKGPKDKLSSFQQGWLGFINDSKGQAVIAEVHE